MIPDSHYILPWHTPHAETHSAASLISYSLPAGLLVYWVFQYFIKVPMIELLPDGAYARWRPHESPAAIRSLRQWLLAACGILAGAFTHLVWDAFTHEGARGVRMLPVQDEPAVDFGHHHLSFVRLMQDLSSLLGLALVVAMICYGLRRGHEQRISDRRLPSTERRVWTVSFAFVTIVLFAAFFGLGRWLDPFPSGITLIVYDSAIASLRALATAIIVVAAAMQVRLRAAVPTPDHLSSGPER
jgi:hypothetical protein